MTQTAMTYGTLPTREQFESAFEAACPNGTYEIRLGASDSRAVDGFRLGDGEWTVSRLWDAVNEIVNAGPDDITVSEDEEYEDVYQVFYPGTDRPYVEIGPDDDELIEWANKFTDSVDGTTAPVETLNYVAAYGQVGKCFARKDAAMDLVSSIMETLGFEWV